MKLIKPNWVTHDSNPIFSVDIHPDGKRFATGGQGGDSGRVVIWNMEPITSEAAELDQNVPKMLCQLDNHLACVNCVRWSSTGLLASGGDDKLIMIWRLVGGAGGSSMFGGKSGVETWRCIATLRSHEGDVLDLAWAPHKAWLASASVDNTVIVWDTNTFSQRIAILKGHTGLVKGITWDPVGKYLASQSDDKTLRVWRTTDWGQEANITEPFEECGGTTHVLRLSWSPDGQYLVSAHAMNGGGPTAQIIERDGWTQDKDFVGHRKAVTCVKFNGNILQKKAAASKPTQYCCVAIGSRDRSLSVWLTCLKRPLVVIHDLFTHSVLDASWSPCGMVLAACSWDGTVVFIEFTQEELGQPLNASEHNIVHERLYGKALNQGGCTVMEAPELMNLKTTKTETLTEIKSTINNQVTTNSVQSIVTTPTVPVKAPINKQIETRTSDGRRRITPMFIPPPPDTMNSSVALITSSDTFPSTSQTKSSIIIEKRNDIVTPNVSTLTNCTGGPASSLKKREHLSSPKAHMNTLAKKMKVMAERSGHAVIPPLKPCSSLSQQAGHYAVNVTNEQNLTHLQVFRGTHVDPLWDLHLGYSTVALAATPSIIALGLEDGSIHIFNPAKGTRPVPALIPPAPLAKLLAVGNNVMVISSYGDLRVWEIGSTCRLVVRTSAANLAAPGTSLISCSLYNGIPQLSFNNARAYMFDKEMEAWVLIGDSHDPIWRWAAQTATTSVGCRGPLSSLQEGLHRNAASIANPRLPHSAPSVVSYLEQQLLFSKALGSAQEYVNWLTTLVSFLLTQDGLENRLRLILDDLIGPSHSSASKSTWESSILGIKKHKILEDVLSIVGSSLRWQRLYLEYSEQLDMIKKDNV